VYNLGYAEQLSYELLLSFVFCSTKSRIKDLFVDVIRLQYLSLEVPDYCVTESLQLTPLAHSFFVSNEKTCDQISVTRPKSSKSSVSFFFKYVIQTSSILLKSIYAMTYKTIYDFIYKIPRTE